MFFVPLLSSSLSFNYFTFCFLLPLVTFLLCDFFSNFLSNFIFIVHLFFFFSLLHHCFICVWVDFFISYFLSCSLFGILILLYFSIFRSICKKIIKYSETGSLYRKGLQRAQEWPLWDANRTRRSDCKGFGVLGTLSTPKICPHNPTHGCYFFQKNLEKSKKVPKKYKNQFRGNGVVMFF